MLSGRLLSYLKKRKISRNGHSLSLVVIRCHSLYHSLSLVVIRCHSLYHSLSFVVTRCHSLSLVVPLVVTRCTTRLSFYKRSNLTSINIFLFTSFNTLPKNTYFVERLPTTASDCSEIDNSEKFDEL